MNKIDMKTTRMLVTPAQAARWLERNTVERPLDPKHVQKLADRITAGRWIVSHYSIAFDVNGDLIDGQHRLTAIVRADKPVELFVTTGCGTSQRGIDRGLPRPGELLLPRPGRPHESRAHA